MKKLITFTTAAALVLSAQSAYAFGFMQQGGDDITVNNSNTGTITINASSKAKSGGNQANGGEAADAGNGGAVTMSDDWNDGGQGGNVGPAGNGGVITTGMSRAETLVDTTANTNNTTVNGGDDVRVRNTNHINLVVDAASLAVSGENKANGGDSGSAGNGGAVSMVDDWNDGGKGGNVGPAGDGGTIRAGASRAVTTVDSTLNTNKTTVADDCDECGRSWFFGFWGHGHDNDTVRVVNTNNTTVTVDDATSKAVSGKNEANGGDSGSAGNGGSVMFADDWNDGGQGGNVGPAGNGGSITTDYSLAWTAVETHAFRNDTVVRDDCDECDRGSDDVVVRNMNVRTSLNIDADSDAESGSQKANGGNTGEAGDGGMVMFVDDANDGGQGGNVGPAGDGGRVVSGLSEAYTDVITVRDRNISRIRY
jgi:hypothetical protein